MRLAYLIELVMVLAAGLGLARWQWGAWLATADDLERKVYWLEAYSQASRGFLAGAGLVGLIGLAIEVARSRTPRPWGLGRWSWAVLGLVLVVRPLAWLAIGCTYDQCYGSERWAEFCRQLGLLSEVLVLESSNDALALVFALTIARWVACPGPVVADAREWAGRVFAVGAAATSFGVQLIMIMSQ